MSVNENTEEDFAIISSTSSNLKYIDFEMIDKNNNTK